MEEARMQEIMNEAQKEYESLNNPETTVFAVAHARRENSAKPYNSSDIIKRGIEILPAQLESSNSAVKKMQAKVIE